MRGLGKRLGTGWVLRGLDLEIAGGELVSLIGPSGCGKTTTLNCILGLLRPDEGAVDVDGADVTGLPPEKRDFGMVFQSYALFPHLDVRRNVAFGLAGRNLDRQQIHQRVDDALAMVHLERLAGRYPAQLSAGEQQRVALARTIATQPRLVLMDEPLSNLDARLRLEMRTEIRRLHLSLGLTTILVTHDQAEALSLSDRIALMRDGRIVQVGTPQEVHSSPASAYAASFLGYRNRVPVSVDRVEGGRLNLLLADGTRLVGTSPTPPPAGARATAWVRPEDVRIGAVPNGEDATSLKGLVEITEYVGAGFEVGLRVGHMSLRAFSELQPEVGQEVVAHILPRRLLVFPEDPSDP